MDRNEYHSFVCVPDKGRMLNKREGKGYMRTILFALVLVSLAVFS